MVVGGGGGEEASRGEGLGICGLLYIKAVMLAVSERTRAALMLCFYQTRLDT